MTTLDQALEHHKAGRLEEAEAAYRELLAREPEHADARHLLGILSAQRGDPQGAVALIEQAIERAPAIPDYHHNLGEAYRALGAFDQAIAAYEHALALNPDRPATHYNLGNARQAQGRLEEAIAAYRRVLALKPEEAEAHRALGNALHESGQLDEAVDAYRQAIALSPGHADAHHSLGIVLQEQGKMREAMDRHRKAIELDPHFAEAHNNLGTVLQDHGDLETAISFHRRAVALKPDYAQAHYSLGCALRSQGRLQEAIAAYRQTIEVEPRYTTAHLSLALSQKYDTVGHHDVVRMQELMNDPILSEHDVANLHFALGKIHDDCELYEEAFAHYRRANQIKGKASRFDPEKLINFIDRVIHTFDVELVIQRSSYGSDSELPVFILGMPRSGTTLVEQIVSSHPQVHGAGELTRIREIVENMVRWFGGRQGYPECAVHLDSSSTKILSQDYADYIHQFVDNQTLRITDKRPFNFLYLGIIAILFPESRVVHCLRDPLDTCLSGYFQYYEGWNDCAYDLSHIGLFYRQYERLMAHWRDVLSLNMHTIQYEKLIEEPEKEAKKLVDFLGLPWDSRCLSFNENKRAVKNLSAWQVRQPVYRTSIQRWRHYEKHLGPLKAALGMRADRV